MATESKSGDAIRLEPGDLAPDFSLPTADGATLSRSDLGGKKAIIYFYPRASTPGCTKQACDFRDSLAALQSDGYAVVGISPDGPEKLAKFAAAEDLTFPLLADPQKEVLAAYGAFGEKKLYGKLTRGVIRSTVVLDETGHVTHALYNVKATGHVARLRKELGVD
ncbi:MAG TPA: thioredoxin-dependent thiol peroxidase [Actinomycetales bacterium]|nr:thioredoxin-dependent thiol peroxidase [Actinomycetales bacterium]